MLGPTVERLTRRIVVTTPLGAQEARGFPDGVEAWRVVSVADDVGRRLVVSVPLVGREEEIELLHNTFARVVRDNRVHLVTVFGAAGVGKSRLAREFIDGVERSTILDRPLPALRRGRHVLGGRRDGEGRRRHHRRRHRRSRQREAPELLRRRGGGRSPGAGVGRARRGRRRRAVRIRDRLGRADVGDGARRPAAARARLRGHPPGRGADARPDRAPRERRQGRAAADPLPRPQGPARRAAGVGWRQRALDLDRARGAAARTTARSSSRRSSRASRPS